jgi:polyisoprenyl-teichoic acid--peptidoglycan teichoic acid transferase
LRRTNWFRVYAVAGLVGILAGYIFTLLYRPSLLPPVLRFGIIIQPTTILFLGTDVVYTEGRKKRADKDAFTGRSDTIMVMRLDPYRDTLGVLQIPRDTQVYISGFGNQKINAANALGGPRLAESTVSQLLQLPIDHFVVLNVHGLVELVDEVGGITLEVPKRMHYMDWTAKLKIDLEPGSHTLTGNQAMGFVRFRHDGLGDIGRVQRQELFVRAVLDKAMRPESWAHVPKLIDIARNYTYTDMDVGQLLQIASFVRAVPKQNQFLAMMPGSFSGTGDWLVDRNDARRMVARLTGSSFTNTSRDNMHVVIVNASSTSDLGLRLYRWLRAKGYGSITVKGAPEQAKPLKTSRIIAQRGNPEDAGMLKGDLEDSGEIVTASIGDIESTVTIMAGDDLAALVASRPIAAHSQRLHRRGHNRS